MYGFPIFRSSALYNLYPTISLSTPSPMVLFHFPGFWNYWILYIKKILRVLQTYHQSGSAKFSSYQWQIRIYLSQQPHQHLVSAVLLILAIHTEMENLAILIWNLKVIFICIHLIIKDDKYFLKFFITIFFYIWELSLVTINICLNWVTCFLDILCLWIIQFESILWTNFVSLVCSLGIWFIVLVFCCCVFTWFVY